MSSLQDDKQSSGGFEWEDNLHQKGDDSSSNNEIHDLEEKARKHNSQAKRFFEQGRLEAAAAELTEALKYAPDWAALYDNLGTICAEQNQFAQALINYSSALRLDPDSPTILYNIGYFLLQNSLDAAQHFLEKTLQANPTYPDTHRALSDVFLERGDTAKAISMLAKAIEQNPKDRDARFRLSDIFWSQGDFHESGQQLREIIKLAANDQRAWHNLGLVAIMLEDNEEAERSLRRAIELDGRYMLAHYHIACFYANGYRLDDALYHLEVAATLDAKIVCEWAEDDNKLDHLRSHPRFIQILNQSF